MPIYDLFDRIDKREEEGRDFDLFKGVEKNTSSFDDCSKEAPDVKNRIFTAVAARLFFFLLLIGDLIWLITSFLFFVAVSLTHLFFGCKVGLLKKLTSRRYLCLKRAAISAVALGVAIFSPALGTMVACSYFLMYDKKGVDEVVPAVLRDQFREFFPS